MSLTKAQDFFIQWHLTERCNLRCTHCYQSDNKSTELSFAEIGNTVAEIGDLVETWSAHYDLSFSPSFNITGGEPFLRADLFDILEEIRRLQADIYLLSNGTLISREKAQRLIELGVRGVQISMEGPEEVHERIRGKGSFSASLRGVGNLLKAEMPVTLNVTLSDINADYVMDLVALSRSIGVQKLGFSRLVSVGRGADLLGRMLEKEQVRKIYEGLFSLSSESLEIVTGDPVASQMQDPDSNVDAGPVPTGGCAAGLSGLTLLPDGTIIPCRRLFIPLGNIRRDSLREVWATSEVLGALREKGRYGGKCGRCPRWANCRGCRAIAYAYSQAQGANDYLAEDPQCFIGEEGNIDPTS